MVLAGDLLDGAGRRHPAQGSADPDVRRADDRHAGDPRPLGGMAVAAASGLGPDVAAGSGAAVVRRDLLARRRYVFHQFGRRRHAGKIRRAGIPWRAAGTLSAAVLGDVLAGRSAGGHGGAGGVAGAARARRAVSAGVADSVLDRVRTGDDKAAALRAAALSGDRDPHGRRAGAPRPVAIVADAGRGLVVRDSGRGLGARRGRRDRADAPAGVSGLAVHRGGADLRTVRVVALRGQPRRTFAAECRGRRRCFWRLRSTASCCRR